MSATRYEEARAWAARWAQEWFLGPDGADRLDIGTGVRAGWATHVEGFLLLLDLALEALGQRRARSSLAGRVKALGWDRSLRALGMRAIRGGAEMSSHDRPVAFIVEIPTPSMLEPARLVAAAVAPNERIVAAADPRALRALRKAGLEPLALVLSMAEQRRCLRAGSAYVEALARIESTPPRMRLDNADLTRPAMRMLRRNLSRSLPWIAVEHRALVRLTELARPRSFAVGSDQHRIGRLVSDVARSYRARVTVLQHGMPQLDIGYLPVVADRVAAWSNEAAEWFVERGTERSRLRVLGNPRFDPLVAASATGRPRSDDSVRLLMALSPTAVSTNEAVVASALGALGSLPSAQLVVKLHPGHREWDWVGRLVARASLGDRVRIAHREDLGSLLRWADVTLVHRSSVALDSVAAGVPVVAIIGDAPSAAEAELRDLELPRAAGSAGVVDAVRDLDHPDARAEWFRKRRARIVEHTGPLDGRSAERIAQAILGDEPPG
jgi:hypothetical protein